MERGLLRVAVLMLMLPMGAQAQAPMTFTTKSLVSVCDQYLSHGTDGLDPALICVTWFRRWTAVFRSSVGRQSTERIDFSGICPPGSYSDGDVIRKFIGFARQYPAQFDK